MSATVRVRSLVWSAAGVVVSLVAAVIVVQAWRVDAAPGDHDATLVPVTPCRLVDTRKPGADPLGPGETRTIAAHGTHGPVAGSQCTIPSDAVGLSMNVTALDATAWTYWTIWPDGVPQPDASSLNPVPGQPPTPNAVTTPLSSAGRFKVYNYAGTVGMLIDVNGYYTKSSLQELASRVAALEAAQAAGVDPAVLARIAANEANIGANASNVAALDVAQPFTVASEPVSWVTAASTYSEIRSVIVRAPVAGDVAVVASGTMQESTAGQFVECGLMDGVADPPTGVQLRWQSPTGADYAHLSASRVFGIAAGAVATYSLVCRNLHGEQSLINSPQVTAIFTPAP